MLKPKYKLSFFSLPGERFALLPPRQLRYTQGRRQRGDQWCPASPFEICSPHFMFACLAPWLLHISNTVFLKCALPFWFLAPLSVFWPPLLLYPDDGPGYTTGPSVLTTLFLGILRCVKGAVY